MVLMDHLHSLWHLKSLKNEIEKWPPTHILGFRESTDHMHEL